MRDFCDGIVFLMINLMVVFIIITFAVLLLYRKKSREVTRLERSVNNWKDSCSSLHSKLESKCKEIFILETTINKYKENCTAQKVKIDQLEEKCTVFMLRIDNAITQTFKKGFAYEIPVHLTDQNIWIHRLIASPGKNAFICMSPPELITKDILIDRNKMTRLSMSIVHDDHTPIELITSNLMESIRKFLLKSNIDKSVLNK